MRIVTTRPAKVISDWNTVRFELLNTRICDLGLKIEGSILERPIARVRREIAARGLCLQPRFYLSDSWGCPNGVPVVGIPFYLADKRLRRIEEEQTGMVEDENTIMMLLRHEVGHAYNYAYRLWRRSDWVKTFGNFSKPYPERFHPNPASRQFVRHLMFTDYGNLYAQKHPDEDFAETFAVWLTPRSLWRRKYQFWPAIRKLRYVNLLMRLIRDQPPVRKNGRLVNPVEKLDMLLIKHYGQRLEKYRSAAQGYVDDRLRQVFPPAKSGAAAPAATLIRRHRTILANRISRWSQLSPEDVEAILGKVEERAAALKLEYPRSALSRKLVDVATMTTALAMDFAYTGRFMG